MMRLMKNIEIIKPYFVENRWAIITGLACLLAVDALQLYIPRIVKHAVDDLTALRADTAGLLKYGLYILLAAVCIGVFRYGWRRLLIGTSRRVEEGLRNRIFNHMLKLDSGYFNATPTGDIMARATSDVGHVRMATGMGIVALTDAVVLGGAAVGFMIWIDLKLTLLAIIPMPLIVFSTRFFSGRMFKLYKDVQVSFSELTEGVRERFAGIRIIKAFGREHDETRQIDTLSRNYIRKNIKRVRITGVLFPLMIFFVGLSQVIVLLWGGRLTISGVITTGDFVAFISYLGLLTWPMMAMGWVTNLIQRGRASLERIRAVLEQEPDIYDAAGSGPVEIKGEITFDGVFFRYRHNDPPALRGIRFSIKRGEVLGIAGPPGSGKTTLLSLVPRLNDPQKGDLFIDGMDARSHSLKHLRSQIAYMPQEPYLFSGTIAENISFGIEDMPMEELIRASREASVYDDISSFTGGFDTVVGEKGIVLSGGQKQRIALARAFARFNRVRDRNAGVPPVLVLDDPISQVDTATGADIIRTVREKAGKSSVLIASHRYGALSFADRIIVLDGGVIIEAGTHDELMAKNGYYAGTWRIQMMEEDLDAL